MPFLRSDFKLLLPVLVFLILNICVTAQNTSKVSETESHSFEFHNSNSQGNNQVWRRIMRDFASSLATNPDSLSVVFSYEISKEYAIEHNLLEASFAIKNLTVQGDRFLKGFDLSEGMMPGFFNASVRIVSNYGDTLLVQTVKNAALVNGESETITFKIQVNPGITDISIEVSELRFFHQQEDYLRFTGMLQDVYHYYAADELVSGVQRRLSSANCRQPDLLPQCFMALMESERVLKYISTAAFYHRLNLDLNDPVRLRPRLEIASNTVEFLSRDFKSLLDRTNRIYLMQTEEQLVTDYIDMILSYSEQHSGFGSAPFVNQLSNVDYLGEDFKPHADYFRQIFYKINPGLGYEKAVEHLLTKFYAGMLERAGDYIQAVDFNKAIVMFENAGRFCAAFPEISCSNEASFELAKARHGLYNFYLSVADRAIDAQRPDIAASYIFQARDYQKANSKLIIYDGDVTIMRVKLFDAYVNQAIRLNYAALYDSANQVLQRAAQPDIDITLTTAWYAQKSIAMNGILAQKLESFREVIGSEPMAKSELMYMQIAVFIERDMEGIQLESTNQALWNDLQGKTKLALYNAGLLDMDEANYEELIRKMNVAKAIPFEPQAGLYFRIDSLSVLAGREVIFAKLSETVMLVNQGKTDAAFAVFETANQKLLEFGLENDEITTKRVDDIYNAYLSIRCRQLESMLNRTMTYAHRLVSSKMFAEAVDTVNVTLNIIEKYRACRFSYAEAKDFVVRYEPAADFQRSIKNANELYAEGNFAESINFLAYAEMLGRTQNLMEFGIVDYRMVHFAARKNNPAFTYLIAEQYLTLSDHTAAIESLELLRQSGFPASETETIQKRLGLEMGRNDREQVSFFQSFGKAGEYFTDKAWYKTFRKSYKQGLGYFPYSLFGKTGNKPE